MTYDRLREALADRYQIEREIGSGGMATVYLAHDLKHDRSVALKVMKPEVAEASGPRRFLREIETAARLSHPHIVPLYDSGHADGFLFYVMPYLKGESLRDRILREKQLPLDEVVKLAREIANGLGHAHDLGIVHRDVKPANILLSGGHAVVADFGIAQALEPVGDETLTQAGMAVGTPAYMSPEQATGTGEVDGRSDLYGLACLVYEMLGGDPPFMGSGARAILARKSAGDVPSLRAVRGSVPPAMEAVLKKALAPVPADRFQSVREFADALERAVRSGAGERPRRAGSDSRRRGAVALLLVAVLMGTGWWLASRFGPSTPPPQAVVVRVAADFPPPPHPAGTALRVFSERLSEAIPGSEARLYFAGELHTVPEAFQALRDGTLEVAWGQFGKITLVEPLANTILVPGVLSTVGAVDALDAMRTTQAIFDRFETVHGIKVLGTAHMSFGMGIAARHRIVGPEGLRGQTLRSMGPVDNAQLEAWGASPNVMAFGEVAGALDAGAIDGLVTSIGGWSDLKDHVPYYTIAGVNGIVGDYYWLGVSRRWWDALEESTQSVFRDLLVEEVIPLQKQLNYCVDRLSIQQFATDDPESAGIYVLSAVETEELDQLRRSPVLDWVNENIPQGAHVWLQRFIEDAESAVADNPPESSWIEQTDCEALMERGLLPAAE